MRKSVKAFAVSLSTAALFAANANAMSSSICGVGPQLKVKVPETVVAYSGARECINKHFSVMSYNDFEVDVTSDMKKALVDMELLHEKVRLVVDFDSRSGKFTYLQSAPDFAGFDVKSSLFKGSDWNEVAFVSFDKSGAISGKLGAFETFPKLTPAAFSRADGRYANIHGQHFHRIEVDCKK